MISDHRVEVAELRFAQDLANHQLSVVLVGYPGQCIERARELGALILSPYGAWCMTEIYCERDPGLDDRRWNVTVVMSPKQFQDRPASFKDNRFPDA